MEPNNTKQAAQFAAAIAVVFAVTAMPSHAHFLPSPGGLGAGVAHPLTGLDHILGMVGVGVWTGQNSDTKPEFGWLPVGFVIGMMAGGILGMSGVPFHLVDLGIAGSVLLVGAIIALGSQLPFAAAVGLTTIFGGLHGFAHGQELPIASNALQYGLGFVAATLGLLAFGFGISVAVRRLSWPAVVSVVGAGLAAAGLALAASVVGT